MKMTLKLESSAPHLTDPANYPGPFKDWGVIPTMIEGSSHTSGVVIFKGPKGESEFCHFLLGRCTYTHESGEVIEIVPDTVAFFPKDWKGTCRVHETIRKVYMIR
jgi:uncharacterized cupin superfamily protein